jgi:CRISPR/Cas system-associated exonuclease Cas4 (RecB family)
MKKSPRVSPEERKIIKGETLIDALRVEVEGIVQKTLKKTDDNIKVKEIKTLEEAAHEILTSGIDGNISQYIMSKSEKQESELVKSFELVSVSSVSSNTPTNTSVLEIISDTVTEVASELAEATGSNIETISTIGSSAIATAAFGKIAKKIVNDQDFSLKLVAKSISQAASDARKLEEEFNKARGIGTEEDLLHLSKSKRTLPGVESEIVHGSINKGFCRLVSIEGAEFYLFGRVDAMTTDGKVVEVKSRKKPFRDVIWPNDMVQIQIYLYLTDSKECEFWEFFEKSSRMRIVERDESRIDEYLKAIAEKVNFMELVKDPNSKEHDFFFRFLGYRLKR